MPNLKAVLIRASDSGRYLSLKKENGDGFRVVKAKKAELDPADKIKSKYLWVIDTYHGVIRSAKNYDLCIDYSSIPFYYGTSSSSEDSSGGECEEKTSLYVTEFDSYYPIDSQQWRVDTRRNVIALKDSNDVMDLTSDKGRICVWEYHGGAHQLFNIIPTEYEPPVFKILDENSGSVMTVSEDGTIVMGDDDDGLASLWMCGDNMVIRPMFNPEFVLSVEAGYLTIDQPVIGNYYQGWTLNLKEKIVCQCKPDIQLKISDVTGKIVTFDKTQNEDDDYQHFSVVHY